MPWSFPTQPPIIDRVLTLSYTGDWLPKIFCDFYYDLFRFVTMSYPAGVVGINHFASVCLISLDCSDAVLSSKGQSSSAVRGRVNSVLLLEYVHATKTKVTYIVDSNPGGWSWVAPGLVSLYSGDFYVKPLLSLKDTVMADHDIDSDPTISVQEAARLKLERKKAKAGKLDGPTIIDEGTKEELVQAVKNLEMRLASTQKAAREQKLDLSELTARIQKDLKQARERLKKL
jgi:hypothetical protein